MGSLADRLRKNLKHLQKWARREGVGCYQLYDHDIPEYPLVAESYEGRVVAYLSKRPASEGDEEDYHREVAEELGQALAPLELVLKDRGLRPGGTRAPGAAGEHLDRAQALCVQEGGLSFEINLHGHHDCGLFLDHRKTRALVRQRSVGRRVLNLFCYTGSFSVYAAAGGAASVTSVDLSRTYLDWTLRNLALNNLGTVRHFVVNEDILQWLPQARAWEQDYDLIVCDPPTFSNSKKMCQPLDTVRNHGPLLRMCQELLTPGGELFFSTNAAHFRLESDLEMQEITQTTRSEDYRRGGGHRCWHYRRPDLA